MKKITLLVILLFMLSISVSSKELDADPGILPNNPLYFADKAIDDLRINLASDEEKALIATEIHDERIAETKELIGRDKVNEKDVEEALSEAQENNEIIHEEITPEIHENVQDSTKKSIEILTELKEKVPEQASPGIENAINKQIVQEKKTEIIAEITSKIDKLCSELVELVGLDETIKEEPRCDPDYKGNPKWLKKKFDTEYKEFDEEAKKKFFEEMTICFNDPRECRCNEIPIKSFSNTCHKIIPHMIKCEFEQDIKACEKVEEISRESESEMFEELPDDFKKELEEFFKSKEKKSFDEYAPEECVEAVTKVKESCINPVSSIDAPNFPPCIPGKLDAIGSVGDIIPVSKACLSLTSLEDDGTAKFYVTKPGERASAYFPIKVDKPGIYGVHLTVQGYSGESDSFLISLYNPDGNALFFPGPAAPADMGDVRFEFASIVSSNNQYDIVSDDVQYDYLTAYSTLPSSSADYEQAYPRTLTQTERRPVISKSPYNSLTTIRANHEQVYPQTQTQPRPAQSIPFIMWNLDKEGIYTIRVMLRENGARLKDARLVDGNIDFMLKERELDYKPTDCEKQDEITRKVVCKGIIIDRFLPQECKEAEAYTKDACEKIMMEKYSEFTYAPSECMKDGKFIGKEECEKIMIDKFLPYECKEAGAYTREKCEAVMMRKYAPSECVHENGEFVGKERCEEIMRFKYEIKNGIEESVFDKEQALEFCVGEGKSREECEIIIQNKFTQEHPQPLEKAREVIVDLENNPEVQHVINNFDRIESNIQNIPQECVGLTKEQCGSELGVSFTPEVPAGVTFKDGEAVVISGKEIENLVQNSESNIYEIDVDGFKEGIINDINTLESGAQALDESSHEESSEAITSAQEETSQESNEISGSATLDVLKLIEKLKK